MGRLRHAPEGSGTSLGRSGRLWDVSGTLRKALGRLRDALKGSGRFPERSGWFWQGSGTVRKAIGTLPLDVFLASRRLGKLPLDVYSVFCAPGTLWRYACSVFGDSTGPARRWFLRFKLF